MSGISIYEVRYVLQGNLDIFVQRLVNNCARLSYRVILFVGVMAAEGRPVRVSYRVILFYGI